LTDGIVGWKKLGNETSAYSSAEKVNINWN
jgi:hypothetical protein